MKIRGEWVEFPVSLSGESLHLNEFLQKEIGASKANISEWRNTHSIKVNEEVISNQNPLVTNGDSVLLHVFREEEDEIVPEYRELAILFEDEHLIVLNKPEGMSTHPNKAQETGTLANALASHYQVSGQNSKVRQIHRLDKDTSGAIVFAKHALAQTLLDKALQDDQIKRTYVAVAEGRLHRKKGTIKEPIGRDRHHAVRRRVSESGQPAVTHYQVLQYLREQRLSIVKLQLETGRTHQIRVHLSSVGNPIAGDELYGGNPEIFSRQALHAAKVFIKHPLTGEALNIRAPFPEEFNRFMKYVDEEEI
ncbi:RluA family pseudouridine synthase [Metabacillus sp. RGM 3146]|uniref:RluA family pseudouridine synthase n=1 Tax=Metabacillus sp. RGM 3146 TaxID=3401092 RepID=UPI003B9D2CCD